MHSRLASEAVPQQGLSACTWNMQMVVEVQVAPHTAHEEKAAGAADASETQIGFKLQAYMAVVHARSLLPHGHAVPGLNSATLLIQPFPGI